MDDQSPAPLCYAILIGINDYAEKPLTYCVRDVQSIKEHLETSVGNLLNLQILTTEDTGITRGANPWPSLSNVFAAFKKVHSAGLKKGDHIYIHFSGHGRRVGSDSEFSNQSTGDLAVVLLSKEQPPKEEDLKGSILADQLQRFIQAGAAVTLVLDCCFSATVYRHSERKVRSLPPYEQSVPESEVPGGKAGEVLRDKDLTYRDVTLKPNWLLDPKSYAILTAAGHHGQAFELSFEDYPEHIGRGTTDQEQGAARRDGNGALTKFLLELLKFHQTCQNIKILYDGIRAEFAKAGIDQHPVLYGNINQSFFGQQFARAPRQTVPIFRKLDGSFQLQAGCAHGICDGDQFVVTNLKPPQPDSGLNISLPKVQVKSTSAFTSECMLLDVQENQVFDVGLAKASSRQNLHQFRVRIENQPLDLHEWHSKLDERSLSIADDHDDCFSFLISAGSNKEYIISNNAHPAREIARTAPITDNDLGPVIDVIGHVANFELVKSLRNDVATEEFKTSFEVQLEDLSGKTHPPGSEVRAESKDETPHNLVLRIRNNGDKVLYVHMYDLSSNYEIEGLLKATYEAVPPKDYKGRRFSGEFVKKLKIFFPTETKDQTLQYCDDTIKLFITSHPTSFEFLELPPLSGESEVKPKQSPDRSSSDVVPEAWVVLEYYIQTYSM
jgi:hypothetical protein